LVNPSVSLLPIDSSGEIDWQKTYGGPESDRAYMIQLTSDGGYIMAGHTNSFGPGGSDAWIMKLYHDGTINWQKTYGGIDQDRAFSLQQIPEGGYVIAGETMSYGAGEYDFWILKLDSNGEIPNCDVITTSDAIVTETSIVGLLNIKCTIITTTSSIGFLPTDATIAV